MALTKVSRGLLSTGIVDNSTATAITIDSGGSVLIGKATPTDLHNTWNHLIIGEKGAIISENGSGGIDGISISDNAYIDSDTGAYAYQTTAAASVVRQTAGIIQFANAASGSAGAALTFGETARIDASGNLLVGTTNNSPVGNNVAGIGALNNGNLQITRDGGLPLHVNRKTDEGALIDLRKDGTSVGSIGVVATNNIFINGDTIGLAIGDDNVYPANASGASTNGATDLGDAVAAWRNLYLSGGVYLGGTGSANELSDYEEGTWTPAVVTSGYTISSQSGKYTKVGRLVTLQFVVRFSAVPTQNSTVTFSGQPFESTTNTIHQSGIARENDNTGAIYVLLALHTSDRIAMNSMDGVADGSQRTIRTNEDYAGFICYTTSA